MNPEELNLEKERLTLERKRVEIEHARQKSKARFFHRNSGALIGAALSLAALIVSVSQVWVAHVGKEKEITIASIEKDRRWKLDVLKFVATNMDQIFSDSIETRTRIRNVMLVTFPPEITKVLFQKIEIAAQGKYKDTWKEGRVLVEETAQLESYFFYMKKGVREYELGNRESIESFGKALDFRPNDPNALYNLAVSYYSILRNPANAKRYLRQAVAAGFQGMDKIKSDGLAPLLEKNNTNP